MEISAMRRTGILTLNILPLHDVNVDLEYRQLATISESMVHRNINEYVEKCEGVNRVQPVSDDVVSHNDHHNLLASWLAPRLSWSTCTASTWYAETWKCMILSTIAKQRPSSTGGSRGLLVDLGLSTIAGVGNHPAASKKSPMLFTDGGGTTWWMNPELFDLGRFGMSDGQPTNLPDCYALGMVVYKVRKDVIFSTSAVV